MAVTKVTLLGSTGSIGTSTLDVIARHRARFGIHALSAFRNDRVLLEQCIRFQPEVAVLVDDAAAARFEQAACAAGLNISVKSGSLALDEIASGPAEVVVSGIVGAAGLMPVIKAVKAGRRLLIANKEPLVMLGEHIVDLARSNGACLLPLDSEHNAIFQCLPWSGSTTGMGEVRTGGDSGVSRILLTGSGGPFRCFDREQMETITPEQACAHPNWSMGPKISVDSATMMNKGLELIEACHLFGVGEESVEIVVHPQSLIHSMVEYRDGSVLAHLAEPDMRIPIAHALAWPQRIVSGAKRLNFNEIASLDLEPPDPDRFPALRLAREAAKQGGTLPAILNAANEVAVESFLGNQLRFDKIPLLVEYAMEHVSTQAANSLETVLEADRQARRFCREVLERRNTGTGIRAAAFDPA